MFSCVCSSWLMLLFENKHWLLDIKNAFVYNFNSFFMFACKSSGCSYFLSTVIRE